MYFVISVFRVLVHRYLLTSVCLRCYLFVDIVIASFTSAFAVAFVVQHWHFSLFACVLFMPKHISHVYNGTHL